MTGEDKQISRCLCKADIIMSLVSVKEAKETNGSVEQLYCFLSLIYVLMCVLVKDFFFFFFLLRACHFFNRLRSYRADRTGRPCLRGYTTSVSQQIKKEPRSTLILTVSCC